MEQTKEAAYKAVKGRSREYLVNVVDYNYLPDHIVTTTAYEYDKLAEVCKEHHLTVEEFFSLQQDEKIKSYKKLLAKYNT